jgi:hypothetical protein
MFINPFKRHDASEYPGVLVPLDDSTHRASAFAVPHESEKAKKDETPAEQPTRPPSEAGSGVVNNGMTVESLKQEILADVAAADQDTPYDRTLDNSSEP